MQVSYGLQAEIPFMELTPVIREKIKELGRCITELSGSEACIDVRPSKWPEKAGMHWAKIEMPESIISQEQVNEVDNKLRDLSLTAAKGFVVSHIYDGRAGEEFLGPNRMAIEKTQSRYTVSEVMRLLVNVNRDLNNHYEGLENFLTALVTGITPTLVLGIYSGTEKQSVYVVNDRPRNVRKSLESYLQRLEEGESPDPGMPGSSTFNPCFFETPYTLLEYFSHLHLKQ